MPAWALPDSIPTFRSAPPTVEPVAAEPPPPDPATFVHLAPADITAMGQEQGDSPDQIAHVLRAHRDNLVSHVHATEAPEQAWGFVSKIDADTREQLSAARDAHAQAALTKALPDQAERSQFAAQLQAGGYDPEAIDEQWKPAMEAYDKAANDPAFALPKRGAPRKFMVGDQQLADFYEAPRSDGKSDFYVQPSGEQVTKPFSVRMPAVTDKEVQAEVEKKQTELAAAGKQWDAASAAVDGAGTFGLRGALNARDAAQEATVKARSELDALNSHGKQLLTDERLRTELAKPQYQGKVGEHHHLAGLMKGVANAGAGLAGLAAYDADMLGGNFDGTGPSMRAVQDYHDNIEATYGSNTRGQLEGGTLNHLADLGESLPGMAAQIAMGPAGMAGSVAGETLLSTAKRAQQAEASGDFATAKRLRDGMGLHAALTGAVTAQISRVSPFNVLHGAETVAGKGLAGIAARTALGGAEMSLLGTTQKAVVDPLIGDHPAVNLESLGTDFMDGALMGLPFAAAGHFTGHGPADQYAPRPNGVIDQNELATGAANRLAELQAKLSAPAPDLAGKRRATDSTPADMRAGSTLTPSEQAEFGVLSNALGAKDKDGNAAAPDHAQLAEFYGFNLAGAEPNMAHEAQFANVTDGSPTEAQPGSPASDVAGDAGSTPAVGALSPGDVHPETGKTVEAVFTGQNGAQHIAYTDGTYEATPARGPEVVKESMTPADATEAAPTSAIDAHVAPDSEDSLDQNFRAAMGEPPRGEQTGSTRLQSSSPEPSSTHEPDNTTVSTAGQNTGDSYQRAAHGISPQQRQPSVIRRVQLAVDAARITFARFGTKITEARTEAEAKALGVADNHWIGVGPNGLVVVPHRAPARLTDRFAKAAVQEEIIHVAWAHALNEQAKAKGIEYQTHVGAQMRTMLSELDSSPTGQRAFLEAANLYDNVNARSRGEYRNYQEARAAYQGREHYLIPELARQLIQLRSQTDTTETSFRRAVGIIQGWLRSALNFMRGLAKDPSKASQTLHDTIRETEAILNNRSKGWRQMVHPDHFQYALSTNVAERTKELWGNTKDEARAFIENTKLPKFDGLRRSINAWTGRMQASSVAIRRIQKEITRIAPDVVTREAITNFIQASGDHVLLQAREASSKGALKEGYKAARSLTPDQIKLATQIRSYYDAALAKAQANGLVETGLKNYVNQVWKKPVSLSKAKDLAEFQNQLSRTFKFGQKRHFESFHDGEQAGYKPVTKDISELLGLYINELNKTIATREMIGDLTQRTASDGRPLATPVGGAIKDDGTTPRTSTLILPNAKGKVTFDGESYDTHDYKTVDNPALAKWKFTTTDTDGKPVTVLGQLAIHPEAHKIIKNALGSSEIKRWANETSDSAAGHVARLSVRALDAVQSQIKASMMAFSPFHIVQEGTHAIGHKVNPFTNIPSVDPSNARHQDMMNHGLMLAGDRGSLGDFMEGLSSGGAWIEKIPGLGKITRSLGEFTFEHYVPGLKIKTYEHILSRNLARFDKDIKAGSMTESDVKYLSAKQTNAAYGHQNYRDMGRNPTIQHVLRAVLLAPDFLEARAKFAGQAIQGLLGQKHGREQTVAMATLAVAFYVGARVTNAMLNKGDTKNDWEHLFTVQAGNRSYSMRSVPEDIYRLVHDWRQFSSGRLSPLMQTGLLEGVFGFNHRGEKVTTTDAIQDTFANAIPMSIRMLPGINALTKTQQNSPVSAWEQAMKSLGLQIARYSPITDLQKQAREFVKAQGKEDSAGLHTYTTSKYSQLRYHLEDLDWDSANKDLAGLIKDSTTSHINTAAARGKVLQGFHTTLMKPWTGSQKSDETWKQTMSPAQRDLHSLAEQRRRDVWNRVLKLTKPVN